MREWPENGEPAPVDESQVAEFRSALGLDEDAQTEAEGIAFAAGHARGFAAGRASQSHPAGAPVPGVVVDVDSARGPRLRTFLLEGLVVGIAWTVGSILGERASQGWTQ